MMEGISEAISALGQFLMAGAAIAGAVAAFMGLDRWKTQKLWEDERSLAREIALLSRQCSDYFHGLRSPLVTGGEMAAEYREKFDDSANFRDRKVADEAHLLAINVRLDRINAAMQSLYAKLLEADLIWNTDLEATHDQMRKAINEVVIAHEMQGETEDRDEKVKYRRTAYGLRTDETGEKFEEFIASIIKACLPRLRASQ